MMCQERSGFLFAHDCDRPVVRMCGQCHKALCEAHSRVVEGAHYCVTCFKQLPAAPQGQQKQDPRAQDPTATDDADGWADDDPYFYSSRHYHGYRSWDTNDYRAFDRSGTTPPVEADDDPGFAGS